MWKKMKREGAFTLVELIIVIVILGILASIAIPSIIGSTDEARETALSQDLATVRKAMQLYAAQHQGKFPGATEDGLGNKAGTEAAVKNQLLYYSDKNGKCSRSKDTSKYPYGPYLTKEFPSVPVGNQAGKNSIKVSNSKAPLVADNDANGAWMYSYVTGEIICNDTSTDTSGKKYSEY